MGAAAPVVTIGLGLAGMGLELYGAHQEGQAAKKDAEANQRAARFAAADALARGTQEAGRARMSTSQLIGAQKVAYAASGVDPTQGTAADVQADTRMMGELDAKLIENNAAREAWGLRRQGKAYGEQAKLASKAAAMKMTSTLLTGGGKTIGTYAAMKGK